MRCPRILSVLIAMGITFASCKTSEKDSESLTSINSDSSYFIVDGNYVSITQLDRIQVDLTTIQSTLASMKRISGIQLENFDPSFHPAKILAEFFHQTLIEQEAQLAKIQGNSFSNIEVPYRHSDIQGIISATWDVKTEFVAHVGQSMLTDETPQIIRILGNKLIKGIKSFRQQHGAASEKYIVGVRFDFKHHLVERLSFNLTKSFSPVPPKLKATIKNISANWNYLKKQKLDRGLFHGNIIRQLQNFSSITTVHENILRQYLTDVSIPDSSVDTVASLNSVVDMQFSYDLFTKVGFTND